MESTQGPTQGQRRADIGACLRDKDLCARDAGVQTEGKAVAQLIARAREATTQHSE